MNVSCPKCGLDLNSHSPVCNCPGKAIERDQSDYYVEDGRMVFTAYFLLKRGFCCKSGCRHCPYGFKK